MCGTCVVELRHIYHTFVCTCVVDVSWATTHVPYIRMYMCGRCVVALRYIHMYMCGTKSTTRYSANGTFAHKTTSNFGGNNLLSVGAKKSTIATLSAPTIAYLE